MRIADLPLGLPRGRRGLRNEMRSKRGWHVGYNRSEYTLHGISARHQGHNTAGATRKICSPAHGSKPPQVYDLSCLTKEEIAIVEE